MFRRIRVIALLVILFNCAWGSSNQKGNDHMGPRTRIAIFLILFRMFFMVLRERWLIIWVIIELNILGIIPILLADRSREDVEVARKYFLVQVGGSFILLTFGAACHYVFNLTHFIYIPLTIGLLIKLGAAPFHWWFPQVIGGTPWLGCFILSTWQKLGPLIILILHVPNSFLIAIAAGATALLGGYLGIGQTQLRELIAYSSIVHTGWILALVWANHPRFAITYFSLYAVISFPIYAIFHIHEAHSVSSLNNACKGNFGLSIAFRLLLLTISGIPPFLGFFQKWMAINALWDFPILLLALVFASLIRTYYYLNIIYVIILIQLKNWDESSKKGIWNTKLQTLIHTVILAAVLIFIFILI